MVNSSTEHQRKSEDVWIVPSAESIAFFVAIPIEERKVSDASTATQRIEHSVSRFTRVSSLGERHGSVFVLSSTCNSNAKIKLNKNKVRHRETASQTITMKAAAASPPSDGTREKDEIAFAVSSPPMFNSSLRPAVPCFSLRSGRGVGKVGKNPSRSRNRPIWQGCSLPH